MSRFIFPDERQASWELVKGISISSSAIILPSKATKGPDNGREKCVVECYTLGVGHRRSIGKEE
jgi:hypothetical protein